MNKILFRYVALLLLVALSGCGGAKVLKEPQPLQVTEPLATVSDQSVTATLDWVIISGGPGAWAKNARWDEYLLRVSNQSDQPIQVKEIVVVDSLGMRIESRRDRKQLLNSSKVVEQRYKASGIKVTAAAGSGFGVVAGVTSVGAMMGAATVAGAGGAYVGTGAAAAAGATLVLVPALAVGGIVRGVNNSAVNKQIEQRQTILPLDVPAGAERKLDVFFPIAPSPATVELAYSDSTVDHVIVIDTGASLNGLHIEELLK